MPFEFSRRVRRYVRRWEDFRRWKGVLGRLPSMDGAQPRVIQLRSLSSTINLNRLKLKKRLRGSARLEITSSSTSLAESLDKRIAAVDWPRYTQKVNFSKQ